MRFIRQLGGFGLDIGRNCHLTVDDDVKVDAGANLINIISYQSPWSLYSSPAGLHFVP